MTIRPKPFTYVRPTAAEMVMDGPMQLTAEHRIHVNQWVYRGKTVDFALMHYWEDEQGHDQSIVRYDCKHSEVHKHQFHAKGADETRTVLYPLDNQATAWETIDRAFDECYDEAFDRMDEHFERWHRP